MSLDINPSPCGYSLWKREKYLPSPKEVPRNEGMD